MNYKVSVVIPTYKRSDTLKRAIKSVKEQTYKNIEIIVVDDNIENSEEHISTKNIVNEFKDVIYIKNKENLGGAETRNVGIKNSSGDLIAFLDDDDEFLPTKLEKQVNYYKNLQNKNVGMIYCYFNRVNDKGKIVSVTRKNIEGNALYEHMHRFIAPTSAWLCSRKVLIEINGFDNVTSHQDATLLLKMLVAGYEVYRVPEALFNYYIHNVTNNSGITGSDEKYINAKVAYREKCRAQYDKLSKKQTKNVEYNFLYEFFNLYALNRDYVKMKEEYKKMVKLKPFSIKPLKVIIKITFFRKHLKK